MAAGEVRQPALATITLPWAVLCGDNQKYILARNARRLVLSPKYRRAKEGAEWLIHEQYRGSVIEGPIWLQVDMYPPKQNRQPDVLNYAKMLCDALTGLVIKDDVFIRRAEFRKHPPTEAEPGIRIMVGLL